jgi:hypothetical protein
MRKKEKKKEAISNSSTTSFVPPTFLAFISIELTVINYLLCISQITPVALFERKDKQMENKPNEFYVIRSMTYVYRIKLEGQHFSLIYIIEMTCLHGYL